MSSQIVMTSHTKRPKSAIPFVFTEHGVVMLSSVLRSNIAVQTSILITRAFVAIRQLIIDTPANKVQELQHELKELKVFIDYNDINEDTRIQLELINKTLAELQVQNKLSNKPRNPIGFIKPK